MIRPVAGAVLAIACLGAPGPVLAQTPDEHQNMMAGGPQPIVFRAFGAIDWAATQLAGTPNSFAIGQFDMFLTSTLSERVSVLAEAVLEAGTNTQVVTDLERLQFTFRANDYFQISAGRYHTGIGFYNAAFHHAAFFETPTGRPRIYWFEDEGGVLPVHEVGVSVHGVVPKTGSSLRYLAEIGNGRQWNTSATDQEGLDTNNAKAINLGASYRPDRWRGAEIGVSHYRDIIPQDPATSVRFRVTAAYFTYRTPSTEIMTEWLLLQHLAEGVSYSNNAGYAQVSKAWGKLRPYYRYDRQMIDPRTPFIGYAGSYQAHLVGLRIDPSELVGIKVQYSHGDEQEQKSVNSVHVQLVFVF